MVGLDPTRMVSDNPLLIGSLFLTVCGGNAHTDCHSCDNPLLIGSLFLTLRVRNPQINKYLAITPY